MFKVNGGIKQEIWVIFFLILFDINYWKKIFLSRFLIIIYRENKLNIKKDIYFN